jgi:hypothetical protein
LATVLHYWQHKANKEGEKQHGKEDPEEGEEDGSNKAPHRTCIYPSVRFHDFLLRHSNLIESGRSQ